MSTRIPFEKLNNTRDLGGMIGADGRTIRPGRLIRSGHLYFASPADLEKLSRTVGLVVDFRTERERAEKPDPFLPGAEYAHLPAVESLAAGVSRDAKSDADAFAMAARHPDQAVRYMVNTYAGFVTSDYTLAQYRRFVRLLLEPRDKAALWHCTAGKDRAGFASVIVQRLLGVPDSAIREDYLATNTYLAEECRMLTEMAGAQLGGLTPEVSEALDALFGARDAYLDALYDAIDARFGGFDGFIEDGLGLSDADRARFRELYLV